MIKFYSKMQSNKIKQPRALTIKERNFHIDVLPRITGRTVLPNVCDSFTKTFILNVYFSRMLYGPEKF